MWTPDLSQGSGPLYLRLVEAMAKAIERGELKVGEKLPPQRQLAWHLDINLSTVTKAFQEATKRHLIAGEIGRGTYILAQSNEAALFDLKQKPGSDLIDLSTHVPAANPDDQDLQTTIKQLLIEKKTLAGYLDYHSAESLKRIQIACAQWLASLGYSIQAQNCVATTCAQNALLVTLLAACHQNETVLVDELTFPGMKAVAKQLHLKLYPIEMDEQGIKPDALKQAINATQAKVLVSDPTLQNPTTATMSESRRQKIGTLIRKHTLLFIEEYVIGAVSGIPPLAEKLKDNAILITSFSKAIAPGIRFAAIASEHSIIQALTKETHATSWQLSPLMAEVACRWIESGLIEKRRAWQWKEIQQRQRIFHKVFNPTHYQVRQSTCSHQWLPVNCDPDHAAIKIRQQGVDVVSASVFAVGRSYPNAIRVSLTAAKTRRELAIGLEKIRELDLVLAR